MKTNKPITVTAEMQNVGASVLERSLEEDAIPGWIDPLELVSQIFIAMIAAGSEFENIQNVLVEFERLKSELVFTLQSIDSIFSSDADLNIQLTRQLLGLQQSASSLVHWMDAILQTKQHEAATYH